MVITAELWDKSTPINGNNASFLSEYFKGQNDSDDRVLISYDGVISRIQYVSDSEFTYSEKEQMQTLINDGLSVEQAIVKTWEKKVQKEYEDGLEEELNSHTSDVSAIWDEIARAIQEGVNSI